jgi:hypothetical protein
VSHSLDRWRGFGVTEGQEFSQEVRVLGEYLRLRALVVEPGSENAAALDKFLHTQAVLREFSDCKNGFKVLMPETANKRMAVKRGKQLGSNLIENSQHLHEMTVIFLLLHLLLAHHLYLETSSNIHLFRLDIL